MPGMVDCLAPGDRLRMRAALDHVIREGRDFDLELQGARADGHAFWVRVIGGGVPGDPATSHLTGTLPGIPQLKHGDEKPRVQDRSDPPNGMINSERTRGGTHNPLP